MEYRASHVSPSQQPGSAASMPDNLPYTPPSPQLHSHPPSGELMFDQKVFADGQHSAISSEHDFAQDDGSHLADDANARRRSINSSKRAAQNRAAQRAFRLRRERYVSSLEEKARNYDRLEAAFVDLQQENHQLRAHLQRSLSENAALHAHLATIAPMSPSLSGTLATPFSPTVPISSALAQPPMHHQSQQQQQQQHHHSHSHSRQLSQEQLRHMGRRSACSDNLPYAFGYAQAARHSPLHTPTSPIATHYHSSTSHSRPPPPQQQQQHHHQLHQHPPQSAVTAPALSLLHRRPQSPSGAQYHHQQFSASSLPGQLRRERSQQHLDSNSPPLSTVATSMSQAVVSPIQTLGFARRFEPPPHAGSAPVAFASSAECMSSPSGALDNSAGIEESPTATRASPQYRPPLVGSESASSCSSAAAATAAATAAQMLPSVREITMSIGALLPTSPHSDHSSSVRQQFGQEGTASKMDDIDDAKRRPW
ncbi:hypothetical protein IWW38_004439 [Coemansia aciculifera]|uniref:Uncharacterized protein n=1 Tax=Coemansia aciculifera TaxID=417176 RepID=A0ACC1LXX5_9FUNG|nr:hypothetical protein IWW38_004439 [Coemansia aciculifera]